MQESRLEDLRPSLQGIVNKYWARLREQTWHLARNTNLMKQLRGKTRPRKHSTPTQRPDRGPGLTQIKASSTLETASASTPWANRRQQTSQIKCMVDPHSTTFLQATMSAVAQEEVLISHSTSASFHVRCCTHPQQKRRCPTASSSKASI